MLGESPPFSERHQLITGCDPGIYGNDSFQFQEPATFFRMVKNHCHRQALLPPCRGTPRFDNRRDLSKPQRQQDGPKQGGSRGIIAERDFRLGPRACVCIKPGGLIGQAVLLSRRANSQGFMRLGKVPLRMIKILINLSLGWTKHQLGKFRVPTLQVLRGVQPVLDFDFNRRYMPSKQ